MFLEPYKHRLCKSYILERIWKVTSLKWWFFFKFNDMLESSVTLLCRFFRIRNCTCNCLELRKFRARILTNSLDYICLMLHSTCTQHCTHKSVEQCTYHVRNCCMLAGIWYNFNQFKRYTVLSYNTTKIQLIVCAQLVSRKTFAFIWLGALSVHACRLTYWAAYAIRIVPVVSSIAFTMLWFRTFTMCARFANGNATKTGLK